VDEILGSGKEGNKIGMERMLNADLGKRRGGDGGKI
jgi:hypothetical protein